MHSYIRSLARGVAVLALAACSGIADDILTITDPDLLNPEELQSAAGANATRLGALQRLNHAVSGVESVHLLGGLFTDEWRSGDSFVDRDQTDKRDVVRENSFATTANRNLHRARVMAEIAAGLLSTFSTTAPTWHLAEMYFVMGYTENMLAETYCNGVPISTVVDGVEEPGPAMTTTALYAQALAHIDQGLAVIGTGSTTDHNRVRNSLMITRGRILLNQNSHATAATAVSAVPTTHRHFMFHSVVTNPNQQNQIWALNNSARRYNVGDGEGIVGINFASGDPRVPTCVGGSAACVAAGAAGTATFDLATSPTFRAQLIWTSAAASVEITSGVEARLIEAESQIRANAGTGGTYLAILNTLRGTVAGLTPLADAGSQGARLDQLYRERAFWLFGRGHRLGDLRRRVRQDNVTPNSIWPNGPHHKGGTYGTEMNFPIPQAEDNNPLFTNKANPGGCIDRSA
jgi:hypothetical protein